MSDIDEDDWFYESIRTYGKLQMFELELGLTHVVQLNKTQLCVCGKDSRSNSYESLLIDMPTTLLLNGDEENRCKEKDFNIASSAGKFSSKIEHIACWQYQKIIATFKDSADVYFLNFDLECKGREEIVCWPFNSTPSLDVCTHSARVLLCKTTREPIILVDCELKKFIDSWKIPERLLGNSEVSCRYFSPNEAVILDKSSGALLLLDLRTRDQYSSLSAAEDTSNYVAEPFEGKHIGRLSSNGQCCVYDVRKPFQPIVQSSVSHGEESSSDLIKLKMSGNERLSVSGFGNYVDVFEIRADDLHFVFKHSGHNYIGKRLEGVVTDHFWLPQVSDNFLVSCSNNHTLTCWEYRKRIIGHR